MRRAIGERAYVPGRLGELLVFVDEHREIGGGAHLQVVDSGTGIRLPQERNDAGQVFVIGIGKVRDMQFPNLPDGLITRPTLRWLPERLVATDLERGSVAQRWEKHDD